MGWQDWRGKRAESGVYDRKLCSARVQFRSVDLSGRGRLLHRDKHLRMVSGVQIFHSTDLVNWQLGAQLDMRGEPDSCGVWAPSLSRADGTFWLVDADVKRFDGAFKDAHNHIVTCGAVGGWSDPVQINSRGFDPSLFHDEDRRKWFLNGRWNHCGAGMGLNPRA